MGTISVEFCLASMLYHFHWELPERMVVEDVDMEEAPELTVSKKSELLLVHQDMLCKVFINVIRHSRLRPLPGSDLFLAKVADVHTEKFVSH
ncbi:unnamed protein product [Brassica oleracea var. botrytis]